MSLWELWELTKTIFIVLMTMYTGLEWFLYNIWLVVLSRRHLIFLPVIIITYSVLIVILIAADHFLQAHLSIYFFIFMYVYLMDIPIVFIYGHASFQRLQSMQKNRKNSYWYITLRKYAIVITLFILFFCLYATFRVYGHEYFTAHHWMADVYQDEFESTIPFIEQIESGDVLVAYNTFKAKMPHLHSRLMLMTLLSLIFNTARRKGFFDRKY